jgi:pimeloyl-ACP methyl ester carboxylesterase
VTTDSAGFVLVASPFTGPFAWSRIAPRLRADGQRVEVIGVDEQIDGRLMVVAHSGGGPQVPALASERAGVIGAVYVDALLPHPGRSWAQTVPEKFATRLRDGAVDGKLQPWPQWWGEERMRELVPDDALRDAFVAACPAVPIEWIDEVMPDAPEPASVFVQLSSTYAPETDAARAQGWPVVVLDADHLAPLTQPDAVTAAIVEAAGLLPN